VRSSASARRYAVLASGSLRSGSTNTAVLKTAAAATPDSITATLYRGMAQLPHFNPDDDRDGEPVHAAVAGLRAEVGSAQALLICTPEYAGGEVVEEACVRLPITRLEASQAPRSISSRATCCRPR
jgi:hypothetical protein